MEILQDGILFGLALVALVASVLLIEWCLASLKIRRVALLSVIISFVCIFVISQIAAWIGASYLAIAHLTGYGRTFSYALFALFLYGIMRIYQIVQQNGKHREKHT